MTTAIRVILLTDWDPIGVGDSLELSDEYDSYINRIIRLLSEDATVEDISNTLVKIEREEMGFTTSGASNQLYKVAQKLKEVGKLYF